MDRSKFQTRLRSNDSGSCVSVHGDLQGSRVEQSYDHPKRNNRNKCYRYYKYLPAIVSLFFACPSYAETVGGVSATASPIANSSGSVTNQAIQVLQGPYITNTYGGGIQCQGATLNITPFITGSGSFQSPYEPFYNEPVYDMTDLDKDGELSSYEKKRGKAIEKAMKKKDLKEELYEARDTRLYQKLLKKWTKK